MKTFWIVAIGTVCSVAGCQSGANTKHSTVSYQGDSAVFANEPPETNAPYQFGRQEIESANRHEASFDYGAAKIQRLPPVETSPIRRVDFVQSGPLPKIKQAAFELVQIPAPSLDGQPKSGLTLEELEEMALRNNPALAQAGALVDAARGNWVQVGLLPNPTIGYSGEEIGAGGTAGKQGAFIGMEFGTGRKLRLNRDVADQEIIRLEQIWAAQRYRLLTDVRIGYYEVLIAQRRLEMAQELIKISDQAVKVSEQLFKAKEANKISLLQARIEADMVKILMQNARHQHSAAWRRLSTVVGSPRIEQHPLAGNLDKSAPQLIWNDALEQILKNSPEIAVAVASFEKAQWALDRARAEAIPNVGVQFGVQRDNETGETLTSIQVELPIPLLNRNQGGISQAHAEMHAASRNVDRVQLNLERKLATVFRDYSNAQYQVDKYSNEILPNAKTTLDLVTVGYKAGEIGFLNLLTAQRTYFQTNLAYIESLGQLWISATKIDGFLLSESLQEGK